MKSGEHLRDRHPHVRSGNELTFGERAAHVMRNGFGSWAFVGAFLVFMAAWMAFNSVVLRGHAFDKYPYILLNLALSMLAGLQGALLLIAAKRADLLDEIHRHVAALSPDAGLCPPGQRSLGGAYEAADDRQIGGISRIDVACVSRRMASPAGATVPGERSSHRTIHRTMAPQRTITRRGRVGCGERTGFAGGTRSWRHGGLRYPGRGWTRRRTGSASAAISWPSAAKVLPLMTASQCGHAAAIPPASGR